MKDMAVSDRPRERLWQLGAPALNNHELLAVILNAGTRNQNVVHVAEALLARFGSLGALRNATLAQLKDQKGIGKVRAAQLQAALVLGQRLTALEPDEHTVIHSPQ